MIDDVILNKCAIIQQCLKRIEVEYKGHEEELFFNFTKQDSIILNLQRACEAAIDLGMRVVRIKKLGPPQSSRGVFECLEQEGILTGILSKDLQAMVGFRDSAIHDYQKINAEVLQSILKNKLVNFESLIQILRQT
jgi:uncharacterized protein YutE (UPF0331/DUF86 family)